MEKKEEKKLPTLSGKQKRYLKGLGHALSPLVYIGKEGLSESVIEATAKELLHRELIKVKIGSNSEIGKNEAAELLPVATQSCLVQLIGKTLLLYKKNPKRDKEQRIVIPKG